MSQKAYSESNKCRLCKKNFSVSSVRGNPYRHCPDCRAKKIEEFNESIKGEK